MMKKLFCLTLTLLCLCATVTAADDFRFGWYGKVWNSGEGADIINSGAKIVVLYNRNTAWSTIEDYLDDAEASGVKVILDLYYVYTWSNGQVVGMKTTTEIRNFVREFKDHPALLGWYVFDEPDHNDSPIISSYCNAAATLVRLDSSKPCFITFAPSALNPDDQWAAYEYIDKFKDAFDVFMVDCYLIWQGDSEFDHIEHEYGDSYYDSVIFTIGKATNYYEDTGKPWWFVVQGIGEPPSYPSWPYRLPTVNEFRFMVYWSYIYHAKGVVTWEYDFSRDSVAMSGEPYPYNGQTWINNAFKTVAKEMNICGHALGAGSYIAVADDCYSVATKSRCDPTTGKYYIVATHWDRGTHTVTFTESLPETFSYAYPLDGSTVSGYGSPIGISNGQWTDTFPPFKVVVYELRP